MADAAQEVLDIQEIWPSKTGITDVSRDQLGRISLASMESLRSQWSKRRSEVGNEAAITVFSDQLANEWAIETGQIENLYEIERGVTLALIENGISAAILERGSTNRPAEEVLALINDQRDALQGLFDFVKKVQPLSVGYIKSLHAALTRSQSTAEAIDLTGTRIEVELIKGDWKKHPNFPQRDGKLFKYCPVEQTQSEMEKLVELHLAHDADQVPWETQAAWLHHRFTQIHPFQDGNGRVARALASLVLIRGGMFPMVVRLEDKNPYLDALEAADSGDLRPLVLTIARGQQDALRKANDLIARLAPDAATVEEAAEKLAEAVQNSSSAKWNRAKRRVRVLQELASTHLDLALKSAVKVLSDSMPGAKLATGAMRDLDSKTLDAVNDKDIEGKITLPAYLGQWNVNIPKTWALTLVCAPLAYDLDERVVAHVQFRTGNRDRKLGIGPLYFGSTDKENELEARVSEWSRDVVTSVLNGFTKGRY